MAQKIPLKTTFFSRVCVFLPFQPFLPSLQYFQSLAFSSHSSVFQSQAAEQAQGVTKHTPKQSTLLLQDIPSSEARHFQPMACSTSPVESHWFLPLPTLFPCQASCFPTRSPSRHSQMNKERSWHKDRTGSLCQLAGIARR